ncbi:MULTISPECIES: hypothetical protein [Streptomyces]|uniref:Uncharacterized protein n=3 Tax=Streptomyces TaxID=1883 RepID=A0A3Q9FXR4_STRLT|nr:hypothetical protein [Streptomyces luteoverticillatus]AZQ72636.1 hypothetical protein EKH77_16685 [Streptomyces luteoverticillatus]
MSIQVNPRSDARIIRHTLTDNPSDGVADLSVRLRWAPPRVMAALDELARHMLVESFPEDGSGAAVTEVRTPVLSCAAPAPGVVSLRRRAVLREQVG